MALGLKVTEEQAAKRVTRPGRHAQNLELVEGPANAVKNAVTRHTWIDAFRFAKLVGIQRQYALDHIEYDRYVHPLVGEAASVEIRKRDAKIGPRRYWRMEFNKAQALELKRRIDEQERDFANGREIARTVNRCPAWVSHIFHEKGEKRGDRRVLKISVGEETRNVSVYSLGRKGDKFRITLMKRDHLQLFAAWTREKGNTQTWNPAEKSEIPEGWVTTTVAGRALGFATPDVSVRNRIESAVIANWQRLRDGRIVVLETEIMKLKRRKDESTQKTIKLRRFCKRELGMTDHQVDGSVRKDILSNQIFVMKKLDGTDATVPVSKDFDGELTVSNADAKELKKIHKKREAGLIDREEAARILEVSQGTIIRYTDQKTETVGLILEDGTTYTIQAVLEGSEYRFVRNDVTAAKRAGDSAKQKFVGAEHIAGRTGLRIETIRRIFAENDHVFETKKRMAEL